MFACILNLICQKSACGGGGARRGQQYNITYKCTNLSNFQSLEVVDREVLIFANFAKRKNVRIQKSREKYYYDSATKEK